MKRHFAAILALVLLPTLCGCTGKTEAPTASPTAADIQAVQLTHNPAGTFTDQAFADATQVEITGDLQHIVVRPAAGDQTVLRWASEGTETIIHQDGLVAFSFPEPNWRDKSLPSDGSPRFSVVSTIYLELASTVDTVILRSTLGDIHIDGVAAYSRLEASTVNGDIITTGTAGNVIASSLEGVIRPDSLAPYITERPYSEEHNSRHLVVSLPGGGSAVQHTALHTVLGMVSINAYSGWEQ